MLPGSVSKIQRLDAVRLLVVGQYCGTGMMAVVRGLTDLEKRVEMVALAFFLSPPKLGMGLFGAHILDRNGPSGNVGGSIRKMGPFFGVFPAFFGVKKTWNLENTKIIEKNTQWIDQKMDVVWSMCF